MPTIRKARMKDLARIEACALAAYSPYVERIGRKPAPMVADFGAAVARRVPGLAQALRHLALLSPELKTD